MMEDDTSGWEKLLRMLHSLTMAGRDEAVKMREVHEAADAAKAAAEDSSLSSATQVSFSVPPAEAGDNGSFHLRVRYGTNAHVLYGKDWSWTTGAKLIN